MLGSSPMDLSRSQVPYDGSLDDLWSSVAYDPQGEFQGYGYGQTRNEARAGAWITVWWPDCDLRAIPRVVPEGWSFETHPPGESLELLKGHRSF